MTLKYNRINNYYLWILIGIFINLYPLHSQISYGGYPITLDYTNENKRLKSLRNFDNNTIKINDLDRRQIKHEIDSMNNHCKECLSGSFYGKEIDLNINFFDKSELLETSDNKRLWKINLESDNAEGYQVIFDKFHLVEGTKLFVYNEDKSMILGSFTSENNRECNTFITQHITGNKITIEYSEPKDVDGSEISIGKIVYIFNSPYKGPFTEQGSAPCQVNTECLNDGYEIEIKSTVLILEKVNSYWGHCSATLINDGNNFKNNEYPYLLTANHCYEIREDIENLDGSTYNVLKRYSNPKDWVFVFRHESLTCGGNGSDIIASAAKTKSALGASILSRSPGLEGNDYLLLKLNDKVNNIAKYDIAFAGWSTYLYDVSSSKKFLGVHHPKGDIKKASASTLKPVSESWTNQFSETHWRIIFNEGFNTQPGSSGSGLFNDRHILVGVLTYGPGEEPTCSSPIEDRFSGYGKLCYDLIPELMGSSTSYIPQYNPNPDPNPDPDPNPKPEEPYLKLTGETITEIDKPISFKMTAKFRDKSIHGQKIYWQLIFNRLQEVPFPENCERSSDVHCFEHSTNIRYGESTLEVKNDSSLIYHYPGQYRCTVIIKDSIDGSEKQTAFNWYPYVNQYDLEGHLDKKDECSTVNFEILNPKPKYVIGDVIRVKSEITIADDTIFSNWSRDGCHRRHCTDPISQEYYQLPNHEGIFSVSWLVNGEKKIYEEYTTSYNLRNVIKGKYYVDKEWEFQLTEPGLNTIILEPTGAWHDRLNWSPHSLLSNELLPTGININKERKHIIVADCEGKITINKNFHPLVYKRESIPKSIGKGTIEIENINFDSYEYEITAYKKIILKHGTKVKKGTKFNAKIVDCHLSVNNLQYSEKTDSLFDEVKDESSIIEELENILGEINIYPNPTTGLIKLDIPSEMQVSSIEVHDLSGRNILKKSYTENPSEIDLTGNPPGVYILRIYHNGGLHDHRIMLK